MKILVYFLTLTIATVMALYNHRAFIGINRLIEQLNLISTQLEQRGRQRYILQKHLTVAKSATEYSPKQLAELIDSKIFETSENQYITATAYPNIINWKKSTQIKAYFHKLLEQFPINNPNEILSSQSFNIEAWTSRMADTLDQLQQEDILIANGLNQLMISRLAKIVTVNIILVASIFLIVLIFNYKNNKANLLNKNKLNQSLLSREKALISSKKVLLSLMEDLSHQKKAAISLSEEFEKVNQKLKFKNRDMQQFIYTISHDLKAPLVTIGGFTKLLHEQLHEQLNENQNRKFVRIKENITEMQSLLTDLLEISRVLTQDLEKSSVDVHELTMAKLKPLEVLIEQSNANIEIIEPMLEIYANPRLLGLCISNLVSNAINHRDKQRDLVIKIDTELTTAGVKFSVKDNGVGVDIKDHERIFKVFERLSEREGSGVGLAIVKAVVEKHDGVIELNSTLGVGSTFSLIFPFADGQQ